MNFLLEFLPIIIYVLLIIVLLIGIVLAIKCLITLDKVEKVVDNVNDKIRLLDGVFNIIDGATDRIVLITDKVVEGLTTLIASIFKSKKEKEKAQKVENATVKKVKKNESK